MKYQYNLTINVEDLTLDDWIEIANDMGNKPMRGFYQWIKHVSKETLSQYTLEDWEAIAEQLEQSDSWVYYRYKEYRNENI
jgi:hypothetical protein